MPAKISVIIPAYNVAAYVERAVRSVLKQTFADFELIVVNDGSTDDTGRLLDVLAKEDGRMRVLHTLNGGAPAARNLGIDQASGDFFYFMDADDWAEPDMLASLYALAQTHALELTIAGFYIDTFGRGAQPIRQQILPPTRVYPSIEAFREEAHRLFDRNLLYTPWNKLYSRRLILENNIRFPDTFWDDFPFNIEVLKAVKRVGCLPYAGYHFERARSESETAKYRADMYEKREQEHRWMLELYALWGVDSPESREVIARRYVERLIGCIENWCSPDSPLTPAQQTARIRAMCDNPQTAEALQNARPNSLMMRAMLLPIRLGNPRLARWEGLLVSWVKRRHFGLFAKLKANR